MTNQPNYTQPPAEAAMAIALHFAHHANRSIRERESNAYIVSTIATGEALAPLRQLPGPVENGLTCYRGVFATEAEAAAAVLDGVGHACKLVEQIDGVTGDRRLFVMSLNAPMPGGSGMQCRVLASDTPAGRYFAKE